MVKECHLEDCKSIWKSNGLLHEAQSQAERERENGFAKKRKTRRKEVQE